MIIGRGINSTIVRDKAGPMDLDEVEPRYQQGQQQHYLSSPFAQVKTSTSFSALSGQPFQPSFAPLQQAQRQSVPSTGGMLGLASSINQDTSSASIQAQQQYRQEKSLFGTKNSQKEIVPDHNGQEKGTSSLTSARSTTLPRKRKKREVLDQGAFLPDVSDILPHSAPSISHGYPFFHDHPNMFTHSHDPYSSSSSQHTKWSFWSVLRNLILAGLVLPVLYITYITLSTIASDLQAKHTHRISILTTQITACADHFALNKCHPSTRVPAVEEKCREWEVCMLMDPTGGGALGIAAEVAADVLNKLVDPLSYKTMGFGLVLMSVCLLFIVLGFAWSSRSSLSPPSSAPHVPYPMFYPPPPGYSNHPQVQGPYSMQGFGGTGAQHGMTRKQSQLTSRRGVKYNNTHSRMGSLNEYSDHRRPSAIHFKAYDDGEGEDFESDE